MPLPVSPTNYGPPQLDFSALGDLGNNYFQGAEQRRKYDLARAFQGGIPRKADGTPDTQSMYEILAQHGAVDIPNLQDQADRNAVQRMVAPGGQSAAPQPAALAPQAATGAAVAPPQRQQPPGTGDFRSATPAPNVSRETSPQNEGALARNAEGGESLRTLATGLSNNTDVSDIIQRYAQVSKINQDDPLTPEQEAKLKPLLAKSIAARTGAQIGAPPAASHGSPSASGNEAQANALAQANGYPDYRTAIVDLRRKGSQLAGNPRGREEAVAARGLADDISKAFLTPSPVGEVQRQQSNLDRAFAEQQRQFNVGAEGGKVPAGFERIANGGMRPIPGGPEDPAFQAAKTEATVKPTFVPHKIGVDTFGNDIMGSFDPRTGAFYDTNGRKIDSGTGATAPAKESAIPAKDLELDKKAGRNVEYLQSLEPEQQGLVRKVANYEINPASLSIKGGHRERVLAAVAQFEPSYDQKNYLAFADGLKKFGASKEGDSVRSFNVGIEHIDQLLELGHALDKGDIPKVNELRNWVKANLGQDAPTNFNGLKAIVGAEIVKAIVGAGGGTGEERAAAARSVSGASSMKQLEGIAKTYGSAMGAQLIGLQRQYEQSTGRKDFDRLLSPQAIRARDSHNAPAVSGAGNAASAAPPMAERKTGQVYPTPKGPMTWTGTGWLPAQPQ